MTALAPTLQAFFTERLIGQRRASPHTIAGYRDTFRLLLGFAAEQTGKRPCDLDVGDLDALVVASFLDHLEHARGNAIATRNNRLAAVHSLFGWASLHHPEHAASIQRVLAIPPKRVERNLVTFLTEEEVNVLIATCNRDTWTGRRDHAMLVLFVQTGLRISELASLNCADITLGTGAHVSCLGKGRKHRQTPLVPLTISVLKIWLAERGGSPSDVLFPTSKGRHLSRDAIERRIRLYATQASAICPSINTKHVTAHTLRHTCAMSLLRSQVPVEVISLWLGHEQVSTSNIYLHADMSMKEQAIERVRQPNTTPGRYRPPDPLLAFLEAL